jgi:hypothetical protein
MSSIPVTPEWLTAIGTLGSFAAVAALVQLRHMRASNQLGAKVSCRSWITRNALAREGSSMPRRTPKSRCAIGSTRWKKNRLVSERTFMDLFAKLITYYWSMLPPAIAVMRRSRGEAQHHDFEFLAMRADQWLTQHPGGAFPIGLRRTPLPDPGRMTKATTYDGRRLSQMMPALPHESPRP